MKRVLFFCLMISCLVETGAQDARIPSEKPRLIVGIVIDQVRADYIYRFWDQLSKDGFRRLLNEGTTCTDASFSYMFAQTGVGHATISTGTSPSYHGIVSDQWYTRVQNRITTSTGDSKAKTIEGSYSEGQASPVHLLTTTIGDEIRLASNAHSRVYSVSLDASSAILSVGHTANAAYWYDNEQGNWITSSYYMNELPKWIRDFNQKKLPETYLERMWEPLYPMSDYQVALPDHNPYETGIKGQFVFPYNLETLSKPSRGKREFSLLKSTPWGNTFTKDFAISTIVNEGLGKGEFTDMIAVTFASIQYIGKAFGPTSVELMDAFLRLDADIAHFLRFLDEEFGKHNVLLYLTSSHGAALNPAYLADNKIPVSFFNSQSGIALLKSYLNLLYGKGDWVSMYYAQQIYLNHQLIEDAKLNLDEVQTKVARFMLQFSGVANTITASTLHTTNFSSGIFYKIQNGYSQKRSGDVILNLEPGWIEKDGNSTSHTSAYSYDTQVPLIWYGWRIGRRTINQPVNLVDIAPTIARLLNIPRPNASTGNPIIQLTE
jgi:predicted AlkP superfamily pyrophosphatase or phosphodiesterase